MEKNTSIQIKTGIGFSKNLDPALAAKQAAIQARENFTDEKPDFAIVFSTIDYDPEITLPIISQTLQISNIIGSSTPGIILPNSTETHGISVLCVQSNDLKTGIGSIEQIQAQDRFQAGQYLAQNSLNSLGNFPRQNFIFFVDSLMSDTARFIQGMQAVLGNVFPIIGAGSCDDFHFQRNFQVFHNEALMHSAVGLVLGGHVNIGFGSRHGWKPLGKPRTITRTTGNIINKIDDKRASSIYEEYFGKEYKELRDIQLSQMAILYPLGIYTDSENEFLLRNAIDLLDDGSIVCQGNVPEGETIHIMIGNKESCFQSTADATIEAMKGLGENPPKLILVLSAMSRLKILGKSAFDETEVIKKVFGDNVPIFGMYTHGEMSPIKSNAELNQPIHQNGTIIVIAIG